MEKPCGMRLISSLIFLYLFFATGEVRYSYAQTAPSTQAASLPSEETLDAGLASLGSLSQGTLTSFDDVSRLSDQLLKQYNRPDEQSRIYAELTNINAQAGVERAPQTADYAKRALSLGAAPASIRLQLYLYWGDAMQSTL